MDLRGTASRFLSPVRAGTDHWVRVLGNKRRLESAFRLLWKFAPLLKFLMRFTRRRRVLYVGQAYYNSWYLSRALRKIGWKADLLNWNDVESDQIFFHGEDFKFKGRDEAALAKQFAFYVRSLFGYDVFHFANAHAMHYGLAIHDFVKEFASAYDEVRLLKALGKKIVYSNNGCLDGVTQTSFRSWSDPPVCNICKWRDIAWVCSDERNRAWGEVRNELADYQCTSGGNRKDFNDDPRVHERPEFYCLDPEHWHPGLTIPKEFLLEHSSGTIRLYHSVGNYDLRSSKEAENIKCTHIYLPLVEQLKREGHKVELMFFTTVPSRDLRFYQSQADIFLEMLTFGWFGANAREAMMLGKPVICYLRPAWLESVSEQLPDYVAELPIVSATPETIHDVLVELMVDKPRREELGRRGREFALKWHNSTTAARRFDEIYRTLLKQP